MARDIADQAIQFVGDLRQVLLGASSILLGLDAEFHQIADVLALALSMCAITITVSCSSLMAACMCSLLIGVPTILARLAIRCFSMPQTLAG